MDKWEIVSVDTDKFGWVDFELIANDGKAKALFCKNVRNPEMGEVGGISKPGEEGKTITATPDFLERAGIDLSALRAMANMMREES
jgi:hypothetical protein